MRETMKKKIYIPMVLDCRVYLNLANTFSFFQKTVIKAGLLDIIL